MATSSTTSSLAPNQSFVQLDFLQIKESFKDYLAARQSNGDFVDYNFEGSIANLLIDILCYNTQYNAFYQNMIASEYFLDTAQKRESIVSRAKEIGYSPQSAIAASAQLSFQLIASNSAITTCVLPAGTQFTTSFNGSTYTFITLEDILNDDFLPTAGPQGSALYQFTDVNVYEGTQLTQMTVIDNISINGIVLPNTNIDTSRLSVFVAATANTNINVPYSLGKNLLDILPTSPVYFVDEINDQLQRVYFGDGVFGVALVIGNLVTIEYLVCSGEGPNGASVFTLASSVSGATSLYRFARGPNDTSTDPAITPAFGGSDIQDQESIRFQAPLINAAQNRCIIPADYIAVINEEYSNYESVIAWGGEDNVPQALGYVFISIKPTDRDFLTNTEKYNIEQNLRANYCPVAIIPIVVDAEILYLVITVDVKYNTNVLAQNLSSTLQSEVAATINSYGTTDLDQFNQYFRYSKLSREIDETDLSINNNNMSVLLEKRFIPNLTAPGSFNLYYRNSVIPDAGSLMSNNFAYKVGSTTYPTCYFSNDGSGNINIYTVINGTAVIIVPNVGHLDSVNGIVSINNFGPVSIDPVTNDVRIKLTPSKQDIYPVRNMILEIDPLEVTVNPIPDPIK